MASKASDFVARFVRLSKKGRAMDMVPELKEMILEMGGVGFEISPQEETAMRLKPNKVFKKALALMDDKDAVAGLVSLIVPKDSTPKELYHIAMGVLLKLSCIPAFANQFGEASPAPSFLLFQRFIFSKIKIGSRRLAAWEPAYIHAASHYIQMLLSLLQHSPRFVTDALETRLLHELLEAFPFPADPFLSWARTPDLQSVTLLALRQANTLVCLQENNPAGEKELRLDDLPLLGDWLDRFLGFLVALWGPSLACGEGSTIAAAAAHALRFADLAEGPERVNRVLFSKARRDALRQTAERLCALGPSYTTFGRQVIQTIERAGLSLVNVAKKEGGSTTAGARASVAKAESLMDQIQAARGDDATWQLLEDLQAEVRKTGWGAKQTLRLGAKGCVSYLLNVLEKEDLTADRKGGAVAGTYQGPVWPALDTLAALAEPFSELNNDENKAFCQELANAAPRLLRFAQGSADALGLLELRVLMDALFAAFELNPDAKWDSRWALLDVLLAANERYDPVGPGAFSVWSHVYDYLPLIPEPSDETRGLISLLP